MRYYKVKSEYDQMCVRPHIHDGDVLIANELYTPAERIDLKFVPEYVFDVVEIPRNKTYFMFGARFA